MSDNNSDVNSWHTNFDTATDDIQEFMKITYYMMGIVDEFISMCDASTYGGFRDNQFRMFKRMHKEMDDIIERRMEYINKQSGVIMEIVSIDRVKARKQHKCDMKFQTEYLCNKVTRVHQVDDINATLRKLESK